MRVLLDAGAHFELDPRCSDEFSSSPLHTASEYGQFECIQLLLDAGAGFCEDKFRYALHGPSRDGDYDCLELLIRAGASLDVKDEEDMTALLVAC